MTTRLDFDTKRELKAETKLLRDAVGTQEQAAEYVRVLQGQLSDYENRNMLDCFIAGDVLADLIKQTRSTYFLRVLARLAGCVLIKLPEGRGSARVMEAGGRSAQEMGALMMDLGQALLDGHLSGPERKQIHLRIQHLQADLADLDAAVDCEPDSEPAR